jgi:hypothetical protein
MRLKFFASLSLIVLFLGCNKPDPRIDAPSYLEIDNYQVLTDSSTQGTNNQNFTDVLILYSGQSLGYFPIPSKIPIPANGDKYLIIRPTIKVNGVSALRIDYPLFKGCDTTVSLTRGAIKKFTPVFKYYPTINFRFLEDFNATTTKMKPVNAADTFCFSIDTVQHLDGKHMSMKLDAAHPTFTVQSANAFPIPSTTAYLEINYKSNVAFEVGLIGANCQGCSFTSNDYRAAGGGNATQGWKKLYVDLTSLVRTPPTYQLYYLYFYAIYSSTVQTTEIYIDNIKVISQE